MERVTIEQAMARVESGNRVYLHGGAATPHSLLNALVARAKDLRDVETVSLHLEGPAPHVDPAMAGHIRHNALFIGANVREAVQQGRADYTPVFLSEIPKLFDPGAPLALDVALIHVSPPDRTGVCSLGVSVDVALPAAQKAKLVIAQVNPRMPRTRGHQFHVSHVDLLIDAEEPIPEVRAAEPNETALAIGRHVAELIEDGSTLQMGIGAIPNAVLRALHGHKDLGVHTEMFTDGLLPLIEAGIVNGARKSMHPGIIVSSFAMGTQRLYDFIHENSGVEMRPIDYTNNVYVIAANRRMVAINSALSVDLTGQVVADSIGRRFYSGIGGQVDFIRGAARSNGGVPIIALPSTAKGGTVSRICPELASGTGVVTTRGDVHWVVTEYGARNLHGRPIRERARMLIDIAHPDYRAELEQAAGELGYLGPRGG